MTGKIGVAISTTGDEHRLGFLETCVQSWWNHLPAGEKPIVTVDGDDEKFQRVGELVGHRATVLRVGQPDFPLNKTEPRDGRLGVAVNKNTGIEALMNAGVDHLFLSDDDTWPKFSQSITKHVDFGYGHSMVCWGKSRLAASRSAYSEWSWPRGCMMYVHRHVAFTVGGMVEAFGPGGHEHVEWSRRIHNAKFTPIPFISPLSYGTRNGMGAAALWHAEDMRRPGEPSGTHGSRRRQITSVRRQEGDWLSIGEVMARMDGSAAFVPYSAHENGRLSATLYHN